MLHRQLGRLFEKTHALPENLSKRSHGEKRTHAKKRSDVISRKPSALLYAVVAGEPVREGKRAVAVILNARYEISVFHDPLSSDAHIARRDRLAREVKVFGSRDVHSVAAHKQAECGA